MSRWGTVAYYLAAWLFGCLFIALAEQLMLPAIGASFDFFYLYYTALVSCVLSCLLFGFLLRLTCHRATRFAIPFWFVIGAVLHTLLVVLLGRIGAALGHAVPGGGIRHFFFLVSLKGPMDLSLTSLWIPLVAGAATAIVLCLFDRAFARAQPSSS
jgi:hypothetical protein